MKLLGENIGLIIKVVSTFCFVMFRFETKCSAKKQKQIEWP